MAEYQVDYSRNRRADALGLETLPESWSTGWGAALDETLARNPTRALINASERAEYYEQRYIDDMTGNEVVVPAKPSRILTGKEANEQYGIPGKLEFDEDTPEPVAEQLHRLNMEEIIRQDKRRRSTAGIGADLTAGLIGSLADPLGIASSFIPIVGQARYAALAGRIGATGARATTGAVEGAVGAAVLEPLVYAGAQWESADYTAADSMMNLAFGGVMGGGLHMGAGYIGDRWAARNTASPLQRLVDDAPVEDKAAIIGTAAKQIVEGRPVDIEPVVAATVRAMEDRGFLPPYEYRMAEYEAKAADFGLTDAQRKAFAPSDERDYVTGFYRAEDRVPTIQRAMDYSKETGQPAIYVEADIANLGGLNARFGHSGADDVFREMAQLFAESIKEAGGVGMLVRHGGDEISAIVTGVPQTQVEKALGGLGPRVQAMADRRQLNDIPHAKNPDTLPPGTRINYGVSEIDPKMGLSDIIARADRAVEANKIQGVKNVNRIEAGAAGAAALERQAPGTAGGFGGTRAGVDRAVEPAESLKPENLQVWADKQNQPYVDPETKQGMQSAAEAAKAEVGPPKELDVLIRDAEQELADLDRMITEEDHARFDVEPEEGTPTVKEIADMESTQAAYDAAVQRAANCMTGRS
jgi:diguanylate cyclase (GGDEF)-like protein